MRCIFPLDFIFVLELQGWEPFDTDVPEAIADPDIVVMVPVG